MSGISHSLGHGLEIELTGPFYRLTKVLRGLFARNEAVRAARLYHRHFSYGLVPDTAICDFRRMEKITSLNSGDCHVYLFEKPYYQGQYRIIGPGEKVGVSECASLIVSLTPISIAGVQKSGKAPEHCWEMDGPRYLLHFYAAYRYA